MERRELVLQRLDLEVGDRRPADVGHAHAEHERVHEVADDDVAPLHRRLAEPRVGVQRVVVHRDHAEQVVVVLGDRLARPVPVHVADDEVLQVPPEGPVVRRHAPGRYWSALGGLLARRRRRDGRSVARRHARLGGTSPARRRPAPVVSRGTAPGYWSLELGLGDVGLDRRRPSPSSASSALGHRRRTAARCCPPRRPGSARRAAGAPTGAGRTRCAARSRTSPGGRCRAGGRGGRAARSTTARRGARVEQAAEDDRQPQLGEAVRRHAQRRHPRGSGRSRRASGCRRPRRCRGRRGDRDDGEDVGEAERDEQGVDLDACRRTRG